MSSARLMVSLIALTASALVAGCTALESSSAPGARNSASSEASAQPQSTQAPPASSPNDAWQQPVPLRDDEIPALPATPFEPARPIDVVRAVYVFAAQHPEVLSRIPCFCGCENRGHRHNDDCFVAARDTKGRPTAWEPHGVG